MVSNPASASSGDPPKRKRRTAAEVAADKESKERDKAEKESLEIQLHERLEEQWKTVERTDIDRVAQRKANTVWCLSDVQPADDTTPPHSSTQDDLHDPTSPDTSAYGAEEMSLEDDLEVVEQEMSSGEIEVVDEDPRVRLHYPHMSRSSVVLLGDDPAFAEPARGFNVEEGIEGEGERSGSFEI